MSRAEVAKLLSSHASLLKSHASLEQQLGWYKQQLFGPKSERRLPDSHTRQLALGEWKPDDGSDADEGVTIAEHRRRRGTPIDKEVSAEELRFDEDVPVEEIEIPNPALDEADAEEVSTKVTYRLAQRPAAYVVLKYIRKVAKSTDGKLSCPPAPESVLGKSVADVSLLANLAIDKFRYHLPLHRQHQRMQAAGVRLARSTLTGLVQRSAELLRPIYDAQLASVLRSEVLAMDETPIKAGRKSPGKMQQAYFWPVYGDGDEVVFPFSTSRSGAMVREVLGDFGGVLISDGYRAYERFAEQSNQVVHAQCWAHTRRYFLKAEQAEPELAAEALGLIRDLYNEGARLERKSLEPTKKLERRAERCKPIVDRFFSRLRQALDEQALLPSNPFTEAARYALDREAPLRVFLEYANVPIDTNHLEREIRPIALGRKNWMFCWTELGAEHVGIFQSLLATCRLQGVDPYTYLVDVLQRVADHPARDVAQLTPRRWKEHFATDPLGSDLDQPRKNADS